MDKLGNYVTGKWVTGDGDGQILCDAVTGQEIAVATSDGLDFASILDYGRRVGNPCLRKMTFHERGRMLRALAVYLNEQNETGRHADVTGVRRQGSTPPPISMRASGAHGHSERPVRTAPSLR